MSFFHVQVGRLSDSFPWSLSSLVLYFVFKKIKNRSKEDWDDAVESGQIGQYVPTYPDEMYEPEWVSWEEWLGLMRPYEETRNIARNVLFLKNLDDYIAFVRSNPRRAEGLRIPVRPDLVYKVEWTSEDDFFGSS